VEYPGGKFEIPGRAEELAALREMLRAGGNAHLHPAYGVGKAQRALEYADRLAADYDVAWWAASEQARLALEQLAKPAGEIVQGLKLSSSVTIPDLVTKYEIRWSLKNKKGRQLNPDMTLSEAGLKSGDTIRLHATLRELQANLLIPEPTRKPNGCDILMVLPGRVSLSLAGVWAGGVTDGAEGEEEALKAAGCQTSAGARRPPAGRRPTPR
jgi:hypothetical protein